MADRILFSTVQAKIKRLLNHEGIAFPRLFFGNFLHFISRMCNYEEEENKIRPNIVLGFNLDQALIQVPNHCRIPIRRGKRNGEDLEKILKAIIPFCNNGWFVYINIQTSYIEYGLLRAFSGPQGLSVTEVLLESSCEDIITADYGLIEVKVLSKYEMCITGLRKSCVIIDFRLIGLSSTEADCDYTTVAEDITRGIGNEQDRGVLIKVYKKLLRLASQRVHGTILLVVKSNAILPNELLADGMWLRDPIDLSAKALDATCLSSNFSSGEAFYALSGLLLEMMNVDGITVINDQGKILGFNVFISKTNVNEIKVSGGARKRAAYALLHSRESDFIGVYFQSQDGTAFYERVNSDE